MNDLRDNLITVLGDAAAQVRAAGLPGSLANQLDGLAAQVYQPCIVAVVGRVKAGKSSFINAFLREDLAKVGTTETTATINYFCYGTPDPAKPVRCYWRGGRAEDVDRAFLDGLQGNDEETLRRADGIDHLEYRLPLATLRHITLVDTPGTGAAVEEHVERTAAFVQVYRQLRERHDRETQELGGKADAVIYLIGPVARATDRDFLEEFNQATRGQSSALNAIGVMAKIDLQPEIMARRAALSAKVAHQLKDSLNTVAPVSAGLRRALDGLLADDQAGLRHWMALLRTIPPVRLAKLLDSEEFYGEEWPDCPVSVAARAALLGNLPWTVFTTVARACADPALDAAGVAAQLDEVAGFGRLRTVLDQHFLKRGHLLKSYRIVRDAQRLISTLKYGPEFLQRERQDKLRLDRFLGFIRQAPGDPAVAQELAAFVQQQLAQRTGLQALIEGLERDFGRAYYRLEDYNADFGALQQMENAADAFEPAERTELQALFGQYGLETATRLPAGRATVAHVEVRQQAWRETAELDRSAVRRAVANRAVERYGLILDELTEQA